MKRLVWAALCLLVAGGCTAVVRGSPLSGKPDGARGIYLTTGASPRPYRTVGFVQVLGYGVTVAGVADVGDAGLDSTIHGALSNAAAQMGGDGVIHIEFLDTNPPTPVERAGQIANAVTAVQSGQAPEQKDRKVVVTGEVVQFLERGP